ncbi:MAG: hypothetical protein AB7P40_24380 [Chloroflexota bacterium]
MHDPTIQEIERWLRECAREAQQEAARDGAPDPAEKAPDEERPYWPYLDTEDFWRE